MASDAGSRDITRALVRFNAHVLGVITGLLASSALFLATLVMFAHKGADPEGLLGLLGHFLPGYHVSIGGAFVGALWAAGGGYLSGAVFALAYGPWLLRESVRVGRGVGSNEQPGERVVLLHPLPIGVTTGVLLAAGLFLATNWLWFRYGVPSPNLELLSYYLPGYTSGVGGSLVGAFWMFVYGTLGAASVAWIYDQIVKRRHS